MYSLKDKSIYKSIRLLLDQSMPEQLKLPPKNILVAGYFDFMTDNELHR